MDKTIRLDDEIKDIMFESKYGIFIKYGIILTTNNIYKIRFNPFYK